MDEHEHPLYQYRPLDFEKHEIRLLKLLPGEFNDEIRVVIFHKSLSEPVIDEPAPDWWEKLKKTLPDGWQAYETVEGRVIFTTTDRTRTSWSHPDPKAEWSLEDGYRIKTPTSEVDFEALSYTWGPHEPLDLITVVLNDPEAPVTSPKKSPPGSPNLGTRLRPWPSSFFSKAARAIPEEPEEVAYVHIRPNLRSALRHLRSRTASRILWVSAVTSSHLVPCLDKPVRCNMHRSERLRRDCYPRCTHEPRVSSSEAGHCVAGPRVHRQHVRAGDARQDWEGV